MIYLITSMNGISEDAWLKRIKNLMSEGLDNVIIREKEIDSYKLGCLTGQLKEYRDKNHLKSKIILHSNIKLAKSLGIDGIHIPYILYKNYDDKSKNELQKFKANGIVGFSAHSIEEVKEVEFLADYVLVSPVFKPSCKEVRGKGTQWIKDIVYESNIEVVALGGITSSNVQSIYGCGINSVAIMSSLMNINGKIEEFKNN